MVSLRLSLPLLIVPTPLVVVWALVLPEVRRQKSVERLWRTCVLSHQVFSTLATLELGCYRILS